MMGLSNTKKVGTTVTKTICLILLSFTIASASTVTPPPATATTNIPSFNLASSEAASTVAPSTSDGNTTGGGGGGGNPIASIGGYIKDSFVRLKDGSVELYTNHKRCNDIRSKQRQYQLNEQIEEMKQYNHLSEKERQKKFPRPPKYNPIAGGITYEEFDFLQKGKMDRGKLSQIVMMMVFAPNFVPYAFMFFPDMLPSPFAGGGSSTNNNNKLGLLYTKWETISRERTHSVISTMLALEKEARIPSMMSNINPFGKAKTKRMMAHLDGVGRNAGGLLAANGANGLMGAELVMNVMRDHIYSKDVLTRDKLNLSMVPKAIMKGMGRAIDASGGSSSSSSSFMPSFLMKGKVMNHLKQISEADEFIVKHNIDLETISGDILMEACETRLIGSPGCSEEEYRAGLSSWLELVVRQPDLTTRDSKLHYNGNLARLSLMCYHAVNGARDARSASYLPRLLYQGQLGHQTADSQ